MFHRPTPSLLPLLRTGAVLLTALTLLLHRAPAATAKPVVTAPEIVPFEQWAPAACPRPTGEDPAPVRRLVVHHTHEPVANTPAEVLPALALTCQAHTDRGFNTIGYHYVVDPWGTVYQGRGGLPDKNGRPPATQAEGAHVAGTNGGAVGVVFLGDHVTKPPTEAALTAATQLLAWLLQDTGATPDAKVATVSTGGGTARFTGEIQLPAVSGHSDSNVTECPGAHLHALLPEIRRRVGQHLAGASVDDWAGLAVDRLGDAATAPEPEPKPEPEAVEADPAPGQGPAAGAGLAKAATSPTEGLPSPLSFIPLVTPMQRAAGTLRHTGLLSLADRLIDTDTV